MIPQIARIAKETARLDIEVPVLGARARFSRKNMPGVIGAATELHTHYAHGGQDAFGRKKCFPT